MTSKINFKKIWALLIALVMMVSVFSLCVFAEDEGTGSDPATTTEAAGETTTAGEDGTTSGTQADGTTTSGDGSTTTTTGGTTSGDNSTDTTKKSWAAEHISFLVAIGIIVLLVVVYFALRLFVPSFREKTSKFWKDYNAEFKKLVWPTKQQLVRNSAVVLVTMIVFAAAFMLLDFGLSKGIDALKNLANLIKPVG